MALTYSTAGQLGMMAPPFNLPRVDGGKTTLKEMAGAKALLVMFICNHCPYVQAVEKRLIELAHELQPQGLKVVGICSNDPTDHPEDRPEALLQRWQEMHYEFPYLIDASQAVAKAYGALCTPDFFLFDRELKLRYRGRLDDSWRKPEQVQKQELKEAALQLLKGETPPVTQNPSMGCSIKWK